MFETLEMPLLAKVWSFFLQLLIAIPGVMIASQPIVTALSLFGLSTKRQPWEFAGFEAIVSLVTGVLAGRLTGARAPHMVSTGRWIWLPLATLIVPDILREQIHPKPVPWLSEYLFASQGEGLGVYLLTLPACSAIGYSLGISLTSIRRRLSRIAGLTTLEGELLFGSVCFAAGAALFVVLHGFEQRSIERWKRVRSVIDEPGLQIVADPNLLCGKQPEARAPFLLVPSGTYVESIERRGCSGDRLIGVEAVTPSPVGLPGAYLLDRVRVLDGPNTGLEGWVLEYGLLEH
ncbi:MAG: hypothetical protein C5B51_01375 [Terriglobia bacterium]|nr:MAG: hypothetical protein C5B51_01375 [Terriglobia bacterium]